MGRPHTQDIRDAATVEIAYALLSATAAAALTLGVVAGPTLLFELPRALSTVLRTGAVVLAAAVFLARVCFVLWRFRNAVRAGAHDPTTHLDGIRHRTPPRQPNQPGRTRPDS